MSTLYHFRVQISGRKFVYKTKLQKNVPAIIIILRYTNNITHLFSIKLKHIQNNRRIIPLRFNLHATNYLHITINRLHNGAFSRGSISWADDCMDLIFADTCNQAIVHHNAYFTNLIFQLVDNP